MIVFAGIRMSAALGNAGHQLTVHIANQQDATLDLSQSFPVSQYLLGANIFPKVNTNSVDKNFTGFMQYSNQLTTSMKDMRLKLLRFPGGDWGEQQGHQYSLEQLAEFSKLLKQTGAEGMIQIRLGPIRTHDGAPDVQTELDYRANEAGRLVDFMNNPQSPMRTSNGRPVKPEQAAKLWVIGNEPDRLQNPVTGKQFTVAEYAQAFIQFSLKMHQNDPTIKVFGPEISQYYGIGAGPYDGNGHPWMDNFLKAIGDYEKQHNVKILDGISLHRYQNPDFRQDPGLLMSSPNEWNYLIPELRDYAKRTLGSEVPIAITEINVTHQYNNGAYYKKSPGNAALWWADTLGSLMNQQTEYVAFFSAINVSNLYPLFIQGNQPESERETAMTRAMQLFARLQKNVIPLAVQRDPVSAYATVDDKREKVSLLFVNKSSGNQSAQVNPSVQLAPYGSWPSLNIKLAAYSIVVVTLHRGGGAEAYNFVVPNQENSEVSPLKSTVCGTKKDPVDSTLPC
jgi:hypothetical protein